MLAFILALTLAKVLLPVFETLTDKTLGISIVLSPINILILGLTLLCVTLLSGIYPALYISSLKPAVILKNGRYDNSPIEVVTSFKKTVDVDKYYNIDRLRPYYRSFESKPLFIMASD